MLTITIKANVPAADAQGIKERIAMDIERYGDCKVVSITSDRGREEQMKMEGAKTMKYRKKSVTIEAVRWTGDNRKEIHDFCSNAYMVDCALYIKTLEGVYIARVGDYIIKGVHGEFYPCKPDIFEETYEEVTE